MWLSFRLSEDWRCAQFTCVKPLTQRQASSPTRQDYQALSSSTPGKSGKSGKSLSNETAVHAKTKIMESVVMFRSPFLYGGLCGGGTSVVPRSLFSRFPKGVRACPGVILEEVSTMRCGTASGGYTRQVAQTREISVLENGLWLPYLCTMSSELQLATVHHVRVPSPCTHVIVSPNRGVPTVQLRCSRK